MSSAPCCARPTISSHGTKEVSHPGCVGFPVPTSLIPVLVTGIQPPRVRAVNDPKPQAEKSSAPKDLGALDACDEQRHQGEQASAGSSTQ
ncbi:hypothetical protein ELH93_00665 [Rhizobium leguminosarum]|nr:hypothetical protein ELI22_00665 [Rhizobium leguminosarum]TAV92421.1 hypothetical protein ELI21_00665 [Rhizobium leguminosarum]TAW33491.1 hypothetical protein ELI23_00665 [Rhizobium leguminosarum]TAX28370.1 hypothetical protein ELI04_00665 [Rhizobium leguminosarum]TAY31225.1 hypothetical protein ELH93_00665 [Rhizobium leguminosarum]